MKILLIKYQNLFNFKKKSKKYVLFEKLKCWIYFVYLSKF
jgi:hypothetical protein